MAGRPGRAIPAAVLAAAFLAVPLLAGCIAPVEKYYGFDADSQYKNPGVFEGNYTFGTTSTVLVGGELTPLRPQIVRLHSTLPAYPEPVGSSLSDAQVDIVMAIWRPQNMTERIPVIVDAGPYYEIGQHCPYPNTPPQRCTVPLEDDTIDWPGQTTPFLLKNYLPRGYAVVQLAVRGTGTAGGCMDLLGPSETHDLDQAITWLGEQNWTNGNVGMIGVSYDGSTPWEVAGTGNPHLKTIVPVSGLPDIYDLMFHNGSAETRGPIMHNIVYWPFGFSDEFPQSPVPLPTPEPPVPVPVPLPSPPSGLVGGANGREPYQDLQNLLCPEVIEGSAVAGLSTAEGGRWGQASTYWVERDHRAAVLQNYNGSVFLVHGLQDWNVDPHAAIPFNAQLRAAGIETKEWYGQWDHALPDSRCSIRAPNWVTLPCRIDFAEVLGRWFDHHLKDDTSLPLGPAIQVQDDIGFWRNADAFPPQDATWVDLHLKADNGLDATDGGPEAKATLDPPRGGPVQLLEFRTPPMEEDLRFSGLPQLRVPFVPQGSGGMLAAWLLDDDGSGQARAPYVAPPDFTSRNPEERRWRPVGIPLIGHAQLNLRYYAGGEEPQTLVPGERYVAKIEFEALEVLVPKGHSLVLWVFQYEYPDHMATTTPSSIEVTLGGSDTVLRLPTIEVDPTTVFPVPGIQYPDRELASRMHIERPSFPGGLAVAPLAFIDAAAQGRSLNLPEPCLECLP